MTGRRRMGTRGAAVEHRKRFEKQIERPGGRAQWVAHAKSHTRVTAHEAKEEALFRAVHVGDGAVRGWLACRAGDNTPS